MTSLYLNCLPKDPSPDASLTGWQLQCVSGMGGTTIESTAGSYPRTAALSQSVRAEPA